MPATTSSAPLEPATRASIAADLRNLGVRPGSTLMVHASLSSLGWVAGGEHAVLEALRDALTDHGTLVMPTQSWQLCDPAYLNDAAIPRHWWPLIREQLPPYDPLMTPTRTMAPSPSCFVPQPAACAARTRTARSPPTAYWHTRSPPVTTSTARAGPWRGTARGRRSGQAG